MMVFIVGFFMKIYNNCLFGLFRIKATKNVAGVILLIVLVSTKYDCTYAIIGDYVDFVNMRAMFPCQYVVYDI